MCRKSYVLCQKSNKYKSYVISQFLYGGNDMKIEKFEDIKAWQIARELVREVYRITNNKEFIKDFGLKDQIRRAAVSIPTNIVYPVKY